jgi:hypothetical protein
MDRVEERPGLLAGGCDRGEVPEKASGHFIAGEVLVGEAKGSHSVLDQGVLLKSVVTNPFILHENDFTTMPSVADPGFVADRLVVRNAVALGKRCESESFNPKCFRYGDPA